MFTCFDTIHERDRQRDGQTEGHRTTAYAALMHRAAKTVCCRTRAPLRTPPRELTTLPETPSRPGGDRCSGGKRGNQQCERFALSVLTGGAEVDALTNNAVFRVDTLP